MALFAEQIPENDRKTVGLIDKAQVLGALDEGVLGFAGGGNAGQIAFDVGGKNRNAGARKAFGQNLQGDGFAGAGRAGNQAMPVGQMQIEVFGLAAFADEYLAVLRDAIGLLGFGHWLNVSAVRQNCQARKHNSSSRAHRQHA